MNNYCRNCGEKLDNQEKCNKCGTKVITTRVGEINKEEEKKYKNAFFILLCITVGLFTASRVFFSIIFIDFAMVVATLIYTIIVKVKLKYSKFFNIFFWIFLSIFIVVTLIILLFMGTCNYVF